MIFRLILIGGAFFLLALVIYFGHRSFYHSVHQQNFSSGNHSSQKNKLYEMKTLPNLFLEVQNLVADSSFEKTVVKEKEIEKELDNFLVLIDPEQSTKITKKWHWAGNNPQVYLNNANSFNGTTAAIVSREKDNFSRPFQYIPIGKTNEHSSTYTISAFVSAWEETKKDGYATIEIWAVDQEFKRISELLQPDGKRIRGKLKNSEKYHWNRIWGTINHIPQDAVYLEITPYSTSKQFTFLCDGVQLIPLSNPLPYQP